MTIPTATTAPDALPSRSALDDLLTGAIGPTPGTLGDVARAALAAGGKRMRPQLVYLGAAVCGAPDAGACAPYAIAVEFLHTATLLHDDLVDGATLRRGQPSAHARFGPKEAVLAGDLLLARCLMLVSGTGDPRGMATLSAAAERLALGEAMEVELAHRTDVSPELWRHYAASKTGALFSGALCLGALAAGADVGTRETLADFAEDLGLAFQMADDVLDVTGETSTLGKPRGADLRAGVPSLPVIEALARATPDDHARIAAVLLGRVEAELDVERAVRIVEHLGAPPVQAEALALAHRARETLAEHLAPSPARDALTALTFQAVERLT